MPRKPLETAWETLNLRRCAACPTSYHVLNPPPPLPMRASSVRPKSAGRIWKSGFIVRQTGRGDFNLFKSDSIFPLPCAALLTLFFWWRKRCDLACTFFCLLVPFGAIFFSTCAALHSTTFQRRSTCFSPSLYYNLLLCGYVSGVQ